MPIAKTLILLPLFLLILPRIHAQCGADAGPDTTVCIGSGVQIGALPNSGSGTPVITYSWSPATDLSCTNCANPVASPITNQVYTLTVTDGTGCTATDDVLVTALSVPTAGFTFIANNVCANVPVAFTNTSVGSGLTYQWNFGDPGSGGSNTSNLPNPTHLFNATGSGTQNFNVTLVVTNANGCSASITQTVTIRQIPEPGLLDPVADMKNCDGTNFSMTVFNTTTGGSNSNYTIQWGDGTPDFINGSFPGGGVSHTYTSADIFDLLFIVTGNNGCIDTTTYNIANITNPAIGAANPGGTTGCGPLTLCFPLNNFSSNHPTTYYVVNYGDGSPLDTLPHPPPATVCHTYTGSSCGSPGNAFVFRIKAINRCDSSEASISPIRVYSGPQANFTVATPNVCVGSPATFLNTSVTGFNSSCSASTIFNWDFGDGQTLTTVTLTNPTHIYAAPGTYTVTLSTTNGCGTTTITRTICVELPPTPNFTLSPSTGCLPLVTTATDLSNLANTCNVTRQWSVVFNGSTCLPSTGQYQFTGGTSATSVNPQITFLQPGTYTVVLTLTNSCGSFQFTQPVTVQAPPQVSLNPLPAICAGSSTSPVAVINSCYESVDTYDWTFPGGSPTSSSLLNPGAITYPTDGTFTVSLTVTNQCGAQTATTPIIVNPIPPALNPQVNSPLCVGQTANFTSDAFPGVTYNWSGPNTFSSTQQNFSLTNVSVLQAGTYQLIGSIGGCPGPAATVDLVINPLPVVSITPPSATICNGASVNLTANGATSYVWTADPSLNTTSGAIVTATPTVTTTYTVTGTTASCSATATATITVNPLPVVNAGPDMNLCDQPIPVQLNGTPAGGTWSGSNITSSGVFTPNGTGVFTVIYSFTDLNGCTNSDAADITVIAPTITNAGTDFTACLNAPSVVLNGAPAGGTWSGTNVTPGGTFTTSAIGTFQLVYSLGSGSCLTTDTLLATVVALPVVDAGADFSVCLDAADQTLNGTPAGGSWSGTGISNPSGTFSPSTAGAGLHALTYTYTDPGSGCSANDLLNATVFALPLVNAGPDTTLCDQPIAVQLGYSPSGGTWGGPNITAGGQFTPSGTGNFTVTYSYTDVNGCSNTDSRVVTVSAPVIANAGPDDAVCIDASNQVLNGSPAGGTWSGSGVTSGGIFDPTVADTFDLVYSTGAGACLQTDTMQMIVHPLPIVDAGLDFSLCLDAAAQSLNGSPASGTWSGTGITNPAGTFTPATAGAGIHALTYSYTDPLTGCSASDALNATVFDLPIVNAGPDTLLCDQAISVQLGSSPAGGTWSGPNITAGGQFTPNGTGNFTVTYTFTNANGCTNSDSRIVTVDPPVLANAGLDNALCIDAPNQVLTGLPVGGTWSGSGITLGGVFDPTVAGTFDLVYTIGAGTCLTRDTMQMVVNPLPVVNAGADFSLCVNAAAITLNGVPAGGTWSGSGITNASTGTFDPSVSGTGSFTLTYSYTDPATGCTNNDQLTATILAQPLVNAGNDTTLCNQPFPITFNGLPAGGTWSGPNITSGGIFTPSGIGNFTLTYTFTNVAGCTNTDSRIVTVVDPVPSNAGPDLEACTGSGVVNLNGTPVSGTWSGPGVTSGGSFTPGIPGTYQLILSNGAGNCLMRDTMLFTVHPLPVVNAGADADFCPSDAPSNFAGIPAGGNWTGIGITDAVNGTFDPATAGVGSHAITYTYTDPVTGCTNSDVLQAIVHPTPVPNFTYNPITCIGTSESFTNTSTFGNTYDWDFGDGSTSNLQSPAHNYGSIGFFDIELIVTSAFGCMDSITQQIEVREPPVADFALAPDSACGPVVVSFVNNSTGPSISFDWNFGNGQTSVIAAPGNVTYQAGIMADSVYTVTLTVTNFCGADVHTEQVIAMPQPTAIFGTITDIGCSPLILDISNISIGLPDSYDWDFGDGTTGNNGPGVFQHTFTTGASNTTYTIQLIVANECGADTAVHTITVLPNQVTAFFNTDAPSGCAPHTVNFTQFSSGATFSSWDFGDGNVSGSTSPTHTFANPGTYTVYLYANDGCGYDTASTVITVFPGPVVAFSSEPDSVCIDQPFTFTNESVGLASVNWDFGDGGSSVLFDPTHTYTSSGTFIVTLTGTSLTNGCVASVSHPVVVSTNPVAAFTPVPAAGCVPLTVQFTNNSTNTNFQSWDFGDGNVSGQFSPAHIFTAAGNYTVKLYVENANGCADSVEQIITVYPLPVADFTYTSSNSCYPPVTANFTNNSSGAIDYNWDFGNGSTSVLTNPTATYQTPGNYTIELIVTNLYGCTDTMLQTIDIYQVPTADFILPDDTVCVGEPVVFNSSSIFADSIVWDFGNGTTFNGTSVSYAFDESGIFPITIMAYGEGGCADTLTINTPIVVHPTPTADFTFINIQNTDPLSGTVEFTNTSTNADSYYWDFGNGDTSTMVNPIERYNNFGEFSVTLIAATNMGCYDTITQIVDVDFFYGLYIPNAISPGNTDFEVANFIPKGVGLKTFELLIYDDWGNLIWSTSALDEDGRPTEYWDGTFNGVPVQQDAYVWKVTATFLNERVWEGKEYPKGKLKRSGSVTVIR